jgi:hypothetical protein
VQGLGNSEFPRNLPVYYIVSSFIVFHAYRYCICMFNLHRVHTHQGRGPPTSPAIKSPSCSEDAMLSREISCGQQRFLICDASGLFRHPVSLLFRICMIRSSLNYHYPTIVWWVMVNNAWHTVYPFFFIIRIFVVSHLHYQIATGQHPPILYRTGVRLHSWLCWYAFFINGLPHRSLVRGISRYIPTTNGDKITLRNATVGMCTINSS